MWSVQLGKYHGGLSVVTDMSICYSSYQIKVSSLGQNSKQNLFFRPEYCQLSQAFEEPETHLDEAKRKSFNTKSFWKLTKTS